jgi:hypothetical protein
MVAATLAFSYGALALDPGQVFALQGAANDQKLLDHHYVQEVAEGVPIGECLMCGARFLADALARHQRRQGHYME